MKGWSTIPPLIFYVLLEAYSPSGIGEEANEENGKE